MEEQFNNMDMYQSTEIDKICPAMVECQAAIPKIELNKEGMITGQNKAGKPYSYSYKYADLAGIHSKIREPMKANRLFLTYRPSVKYDIETKRCFVTVVTRVYHESGQFFGCDITLIAKDSSAQSIGSVITYARRYGLTALLGIVADEDKDAEGQEAPKETAERKQTQKATHTTAASRNTAPQAESSKTGQSGRNDNYQTSNGLISIKQGAIIGKLARGNGINIDQQLKPWLNRMFGIKNIADIKSGWYNNIGSVVKNDPDKIKDMFPIEGGEAVENEDVDMHPPAPEYGYGE